MQQHQYKALLLDKNYIALTIIPWRKVVRLLVNGKAEAVCDSSELHIAYSKGKFKVPSIVRLLTPVPWKAHMKNSRFSRRNVLIRDERTCQYCNVKIGKNATIDHVIPVSRGGKSEYTNCVAACHACNNKKADRTPSEAGMRLKQKPKNPTFFSSNRTLLENPPEEWKIYIMGMS
jgi:5-methylcytosine-specific restriction endonuclease McrA